jgi:hypothetical protein
MMMIWRMRSFRPATSTTPPSCSKSKPPRGPVGPAGPIRDSEDYNDTVAPVTGDVIKWNGTKYAPAPLRR